MQREHRSRQAQPQPLPEGNPAAWLRCRLRCRLVPVSTTQSGCCRLRCRLRGHLTRTRAVIRLPTRLPPPACYWPATSPPHTGAASYTLRGARTYGRRVVRVELVVHEPADDRRLADRLVSDEDLRCTARVS